MGLTDPCCRIATRVTPVSNGLAHSHAALFWNISRRLNGWRFLRWPMRILRCRFSKLFPSVPPSLFLATVPWARLSRTAVTDGTSHPVTSPLCLTLFVQRYPHPHRDGPN